MTGQPSPALVAAFRLLVNEMRGGMPASEADVLTIPFVISGGGSAITTGSKGYLPLDFNARILSWEVLADVSGSIVVDVKKCAYSGFPTTTSIAASAKPTLSSAQKATNTTLTGWTTKVTDGDVLEYVVDSASVVKQVTVKLRARKL